MDKNYIHVAGATSRINPYVSYIGSWYKFRLTNNGEKSYSLINILYKDKQKLESYKQYYIDKGVIHLSEHTSLPKTISTNESIELYMFIPLEINRNLGKKLFSLLHTRDDKLDTLVEFYLFGKDPMVRKATIPRYDNGKFVGTVSIDVKIENWDEYIAQRTLYNKIDRVNDIILFDNNQTDGFIYKDVNEVLSKIIVPTKTKIDMNNIYKNSNNNIPIVFEINNHLKFRKDLYLGSTGLLLIDKM